MLQFISAHKSRLAVVAIVAMLAGMAAIQADEPDGGTATRRRISPVENAATTTQHVNELAGDTAVINAARRARSIHYHDDKGRTVFVDTITGDEWIDSAAVIPLVKMKYPLLQSAAAGIDIWDPVMRIFGQKYGLIGFMAQANLHNRYLPTFEIGLGQAANTPAGMNFTYRSPLSVWFKLGMDYNFLYNSNPDYLFMAGVRYGFSPFSFSLTDISIDQGYWQETLHLQIPSQHVTAGWYEIALGLRVKLWGPVSAGWQIRYHGILHQSHPACGDAWYIPGYGASGRSITGSFTLTYTLPLNFLRREPVVEEQSTTNTQ
ncbi:MAG: hypothetical protein K2L80_07315 [Muribaculaceae bacterium]|nr:hypothetical protein [Muribaculaceae bacterium]